MAAARFFSLARFLILARLIAPEAFGLLAIAGVVVELVMALSNFGVDEALVQKHDAGPHDYHSAWTLRVTRALLVAGGVALVAPWLAAAFDEPRATQFIRVLALRPLLDALGSIGVARLSRSLLVRPLAALTATTAALEMTAAVGLALLLPTVVESSGGSTDAALGAWAVVIGALIGSLGGTVMSYIVAPHRPRLVFERIASRSLLRFGRWLLITSAVGVAGQMLLRIIISQELGVADLGIFYLASKLALMPNDIAGEIIRTVAFPVVSRLQDDLMRARRAFQSSLTAMLLILLPVYATMIALADPLVRFVLGEEWVSMVPLVRLFALDGIVDVLADSAKPLVLGLGHPQRRALLKFVRTAVILIAALPMIALYGLAGAAGAFLLAETVQFLVAYMVVRRSLPLAFSGFGGRLSTIAGASIAGALMATSIYFLVPNRYGFVAAAALSLVAAGSLMVFADRRFRLGMAQEFFLAFPKLARGRFAGIDGT